MEQVPLPPAPSGVALDFTIDAHHTVPPDEVQLARAIELMDAEQLEANAIRVSGALLSPHPMVAAAQKLWRKSKTDDRGLLQVPSEPCLQLRVSPAQLDRALRIMDALTKAFEIRGFTLSLPEQAGDLQTVALLDETLPFSLSEDLDKAIRPLTAAERKDPYAWTRRQPQYDYSPTGKLVLHVEAALWNGMRRRWADGERRPLECALNSFLTGLMKVAVATRAKKLEHERRELRWREEERRQQQVERRRALEREKAQLLEKDLAAWHKCRQMRAYALEMRNAAANRGDISRGSDLELWLSWVERRATRLDPVNRGAPEMPVDPSC